MGESQHFGLRYGGYVNPKSFESYYLLLLGLDFIFNWVMDWAHTDPLAILVIFVFQCLALIINLIVYIMASGSQAMQSGLRKSIIYHHEMHLITSLLYIDLTCYWYIWALRKSWPSVSDQFSFSFSSYSPTSSPQEDSSNTTNDENILSTITTTLSPLFNSLTTNHSQNSQSRYFGFIKNLFPTRASRRSKETIGTGESVTREFYTLWSPGFVALYTVHRTVAIIHYLVSLKATFLVLNASTIDTSEESRYRKSDRRKISQSPENGGKPGKSEPVQDSSDSELERKGLKNFRNNFEILWHKKSTPSTLT